MLIRRGKGKGGRVNINGKTILVTGAGNGIGKELALVLIEKGANVAAVDVNEEALTKVSELIKNKDRLRTYVLDISKREEVESLPEKIIGDFGSINGIINNAGIIQPFVKINKLDYEAIERVLNINLYGTIYMTKTFLPHLLRRDEAFVVNISSMGGFLPVPGQSVYGASKAAVKLFTEGLRAELIDTSVKVMVVFPGATETNIAKNSGLKDLPSESTKQKFPTISARKAASLIVQAIEKEKPQLLTGKDSKMMNFLYRINPVFATNFIAKQMKALLPSE